VLTVEEVKHNARGLQLLTMKVEGQDKNALNLELSVPKVEN
jgi:hypothetical protein